MSTMLLSRRRKNSTAPSCVLCGPEEIGQIAGRAGRYMNDGTFGVTGDAAPFDSELVQQIENHRYDPVKVLQWRTMRSISARSIASF